MSITCLRAEPVRKPWGRRNLGSGFTAVPDGEPPVGEFHFLTAEGSDPPLLVKYLFTDEKLSVQVHPDNARAAAIGQPRGKSEAWLVLDARAESTIGLGLKRPLDRDAVRKAALDGSLEQEVDWLPGKAGDFFYLPAGTVHALGAGLTVVEIQQNSDITYRLYDYGRPRELHIDAGIEAATLEPHAGTTERREIAPGRTALINGPIFTVEDWHAAGLVELAASEERPAWLIPIRGTARIGGTILPPGTVWLADESIAVDIEQGARLLAAYPGAHIL